MGKHIIFIIVALFFAFFAPLSYAANAKPTPLPKAPTAPVQSYEVATVTRVLAQGITAIQGVKNPYQKLQLQITNGSDQGKMITLTYGGAISINPSQEVSQGQSVVLLKAVTPQQTTYQIV